MSTRLTCPGCGRFLLLPADCTAETLSCPRCLALIPNPQAVPGPTAVQTTVSPPPSPAAPPPTSLTPGRPSVPGRDVEVDVDVRRDNRRTSGCMIALAVLGALGLVYTLLGSAALAKEGAFQPLLLVLGILAVAAIISVLRVYGGQPGQDTGSKFGRTVLSVLTISGVLVATALLLIGAGVIFLFVVCLSHGGKC